MDTNENTHRIVIELGKEGPFLSGRSRAEEIVSKIDFPGLPMSEIEIDFGNVDSCAQSFVSQMIVSLKERGVQPGRIKGKSLHDKEKLKERLQRELNRLDMSGIRAPHFE